MKAEEFTELQYGMFIHFGLYSKMARGEWAMNRERIAPAEMEKFARTFQLNKGTHPHLRLPVGSCCCVSALLLPFEQMHRKTVHRDLP